MPYAYNPQIWPSVVTVLVLIALAVYCYRRRSVAGALPLTFAILFGALWMVGSSLEVAGVDASAKVLWVKFQSALMLPSVTAVTCFLLEYAWPGRWLTRRNLILLSIPSLVFLGLILTDDFHHLMWRGFLLNDKVIPLRDAGDWMLLAWVYGVSIINISVLVWLFIRSPQHRWPAALMLAGQMGGRVVYALGAVQVIHSDLPIQVIGFWFPIPMYLIALFGFRILDPFPLARQIVVDQMREGMLVLDPEGRVTSLNPAAEKMLAATRKQVQGKLVETILPELSLPPGDAAALSRPIELTIGSGAEARCYELEISHLNDFRGLSVGRLLLLHDVTGQKQAQAQLLEQQQALAMLHERERLARELHDSLGQAFAFVNTQGQAIRRLLSRGDIAVADEHTRRLVEVAREADVDIRESILGLRVVLAGQGFFPVLNQYLARYEKNYGIRTELVKPETLQDGIFEPLVEAQLLRILQEALTNVRKHAGANCVRIAFAHQDQCVRVTVQDDGQGFGPESLAGELGEHVGLRVMRERAEEVGGVLSVESSPGAGTRVIIELPVIER